MNEKFTAGREVARLPVMGSTRTQEGNTKSENTDYIWERDQRMVVKCENDGHKFRFQGSRPKITARRQTLGKKCRKRGIMK